MATEFEELRLSITLIDDASAGIKAVRAELRGTSGNADDFSKAIRENTRNAAVFGDAVGFVDGRLVLLGGAVGYLQSKLSGIGGALVSQGPTITEFARQQQQANQVSQLLGMSIGQLKSVRSQAEDKGISPEDSDRISGSMMELLLKLSRVGGRTEFQEKLRASGFQTRGAGFRDYTMWLAESKDYAEMYKKVQQARKELEKYAIEQEGMDPELAKEMGLKWLILHGLPAQAVALEELKKPTAEYLATQQQRADNAERWLKEVVQLNQNVRHIKEKLFVAALGPDNPFYTGLQTVAKATKWMADNAERFFAIWFFIQNPNLLIPFYRGGPPADDKKSGPTWPPSMNPLEWNWNPFKWRWRLSTEIDELTDQIQKINFAISPTGPKIVPASFDGTAGLPSWLRPLGAAVTPGGAAPGAPTPGTGADTGGGGGPRSPGSGESTSKTPGTDTGGTPGTPSGQPAITPQQPLPPGVLYNPITSTKFMGGTGATSASRGAGQHQGEDWGAPIGTPVYAVRDGVITRVGTDNFGTPAVTIDHGDGTFTRDLHLQPGSVPEVGTKVYGGQPYARSGTANGVPHLHHERWSGQPGRSGSRIISPMEESGRKAKEGMEGGQLAPRSAKPGEARVAPTAPTPPAPEPDEPMKPAWPRTLPDTTAPEGGFSPIPPSGLPKLSTPDVSTAPTGGGPAGRENIPTTSRSPKLDTTNPAIRDALRIPRLPGESDEAWTARGKKALEGARPRPTTGPILPKIPSPKTAPDQEPAQRYIPNPARMPRMESESEDAWKARGQRAVERASSGGEILDRSALDRASGNELRAKVNGDAKVSVDVTTPSKIGDAPDALFKNDTVERQTTMQPAKDGPSVEVD